MIKRIITGVLVVGLFLAVAAGQCLRNVAEAADLMTNPSAETVSGTAPVGWSQGGRETYSPGIAGTANLNPGCNPFPSVSPTPSATPSPTRGAGDIIPNPGLETAKGTAPDGWTADSWGTNTPIFTYLPTGHTGSHSVQVTLSHYSSGAANWDYEPQAIIPGGQYQFTDWYRSTATTEIDAAVTMKNGTIQFYLLGTVVPSAAWAQAKEQFDVPPGAAKIAVYHVLATNGSLTTDDYSFAPYRPVPFTRGLVSVTLDDGWADQYTNARPILSTRGIRATFYIISGELTDQPDYMSGAQVKALKNAGHEIASHTVTHPDLTKVSATQLTNEMRNSQATLETLLGVPVPNFAYPYGAYNAKTITEGKKYYRSQRTTESGFNSKDNLNCTALKVQDIYSTTTRAQVQAWVTQSAHERTWLILVYHQVGSTPADPTNTDYVTKTADFDAEMAAVRNSKAGVVTVNQAIKELGRCRPN